MVWVCTAGLAMIAYARLILDACSWNLFQMQGMKKECALCNGLDSRRAKLCRKKVRGDWGSVGEGHYYSTIPALHTLQTSGCEDPPFHPQKRHSFPSLG